VTATDGTEILNPLCAAILATVLTYFSTNCLAGPLEDAQAATSRGDRATAVRLLRPLAEQGLATAQYNLGIIYGHCQEDLRGLVQALGNAAAWAKARQQGKAEAVKWFRKAADQGDARAQFMLGLCYRQGLGVQEDHATAMEWFRKAADQDFAEAQYYLGLGLQVWHPAQNAAEAVKWFRKAADQGLADAQYKLGLSYRDGLAGC
jgi:TPR repeat protein